MKILTTLQDINDKFYHFINEAEFKLRNYLNSDEFEQDLDRYIASFKSTLCRDENFEDEKNRKVRIEKKLQFIAKKSAHYIGEGALTGLKVGAVSVDPAIIAKAMGIGATAHAGEISFYALDIAFKRLTEGYQLSIFTAALSGK